MTRTARLLHGATALLCWFALILQYALVIGDLGLVLGSWRFFGFFTILTNLMVAIVSTATVLRPGSPLTSSIARHAALVSILIVGITYSIALRSLWNPAGWQKLADIALHDLSPLLYLVAWVAAPHHRLRWSALGPALVPPIVYLAYAMVRGAIDGWYAYWFLDPRALTLPQIALSCAVVLCAFLFIAALTIFADRLLARRSDIRNTDIR